MEDRKRPSGPDDSAPPAKRQAVTVNGTRSHQDADPMPWKEDIEAFQKDAIMRQMREYKREKNTIEAELRTIEERSRHHDDHLRTIELWFDQLVDEIRILSGENMSAPSQDGRGKPIPATILEDSEIFSKHLADRKDKIISALTSVFARYPRSNPDVEALQQQISKLLVAEKAHILELQRANADQVATAGRLEAATHRYMLAEKKLDRTKSAQVQKLERQAIVGGVVKEESASDSKSEETLNGVVNGIINEELETARDEAIAEAAKRKEQLEQMEAENKKLTEEVTSLKVKLTGLSDDDYAKTDLFKHLKSQYDDTIKRINNLEATNIQLREEAQKYQAERTAYRIKVDDETRATISESEGNVARAEADLVRIRDARDTYLAKLQITEADKKEIKHSKEMTQELVAAADKRIAALESECQRLRLQLAEQKSAEEEQSPSLESMTPEQLRGKIHTLETQYKLLSNELPSMEAAWKKAQAVAGTKVAEISKWEENIAKANADREKANQKYFAAMKTKETLEQQIKGLRAQAQKGTEIVTQLKDSEATSRKLVENIEKQSAEMRAQIEELSIQHRALEQKVREGTITSEGQVTQIAELKKVLEAKDTSYLAAKKAQREADTEREKLGARVEGLEKQCEHWKAKSQGNQSTESSLMQNMLQCQVCKSAFKDTALKTCGHVFCAACIQDRLINRARKCPNCGKAFGNNDTMKVHI